MNEQKPPLLDAKVRPLEYKETVTQGDIPPARTMFLPSSTTSLHLPLRPPQYWTPLRDDVLRGTIHHEPFWSSAVHTAMTKMASTSWEITASSSNSARRWHHILSSAHAGEGWVSFLQRHLNDFLLTDNGAFIEVVRKGPSINSPVVGIVHLDSLRCTRTGMPDYPVAYRDKQGREHLLRDYQVISLSDMPNPSETYNGVGLCAASRAYQAIVRLAAIETYLAEKVTGDRVLAMHIVSGVSTQQIQAAIDTARSDQRRRGASVYKGAVVSGVTSDIPPELLTIPFSELPDGFDQESERKSAQLAYANCIGIDPQTVNPDLLGSRSIGTGNQASIIAEKEKGKGLVAWRQKITHLFNGFLLPPGVHFRFREEDPANDYAKEEVRYKRAERMKLYLDTGIVDPEDVLSMEVNNGSLPEWMDTSVELDDILGDTDKPRSVSTYETITLKGEG